MTKVAMKHLLTVLVWLVLLAASAADAQIF